MKKQSSRIGMYGELRVAEILEGSEHSNYISETRLPYDIVWEGIKIDVKATAKTAPTSSIACSFRVALAERNNGIVMVFMAALDGQEYFWVDKAHIGLKGYFRLADAITAAELPNKVREASEKVYPDIENTHKASTAFSVKRANMIRIGAARIKLCIQRDKLFTLENTVMEGIGLLEKQINRREKK